VLVTHGAAALAYSDRHVTMATGAIESQETL